MPGTTADPALELTGILVAVTTPFTADGGEIDEPVLRAHAEHLVTAGVHGLVTTGSTGEFPTLTPTEHRRVVEAYAGAVGGRVPVIAGVGGTATADVVALAQGAEGAGADAVMVVPPFYGGLDVPSLTAFLTTVAASISIPVMYYNIPSHTGTRLSAGEIAALGSVPGVRWVKDTSGDAVSQTELLVRHPDAIHTFNGWDTLTFNAIAAGARACVWGAAGIVPELAVELWDTLAVRGDLVAARRQWRHLWAVSDFLESVDYAAGIKLGLELVGTPAGPTRAPILPLGPPERERFTAVLRTAGAIR